MSVHVAAKGFEENGELRLELVESASHAVLEAEKSQDPGRVDIVLGDDPLLEHLNRTFRGRQGPTDVISFELEADEDAGDDLVGEIYLSLDRARAQAADYDATLQEEVARLVIHGTLHVLGYDHQEPDERRVMEERERTHMGSWKASLR
jgi:probable rRNA maturation factor